MYGKNPEERKIGQILLFEKIIDERQLERALFLQSYREGYRPLGEVLRELGFVSRRTFHDILLKYRKQIRLGELLVRMGVIATAHLEEALEEQVKSRKKVGQILVDRRLVTRIKLEEALCAQLGISRMGPAVAPISRALLDKVTTPYLRRKKVLPLAYDREGKMLKVLMEDPADNEVIADLEKVFKIAVEPVMLTDATVGHLLDDLLDVWHAAGQYPPRQKRTPPFRGGWSGGAKRYFL